MGEEEISNEYLIVGIVGMLVFIGFAFMIKAYVGDYAFRNFDAKEFEANLIADRINECLIRYGMEKLNECFVYSKAGVKVNGIILNEEIYNKKNCNVDYCKTFEDIEVVLK